MPHPLVLAGSSRSPRQTATHRTKTAARKTASTLALVLSSIAAVHAQTPPNPPPPPAPASAPVPADETVVLSEFVVSEVRGSLIQAQELKQNSFQFVDSIVAQDIGKLPDNSVADALQRIPGIQVGRSAGEVSTVLIRGLPNLATTLNGHEIFTGTGRGVALQDLPAELIAGVDVYKSTSPEQIEGGIAGLIDIRLRRPLDAKGFQAAGGGRVIYGETTDKYGYVASALLSDRWKTKNGGDFGALYAYATQRRHNVDQTAFNFLFEDNQAIGSGIVPGVTNLQLPFTQGSLVIPNTREREAHNLSLQWRPNSEVEVYSDFLYTNYHDERAVHFLIGFPRFGAITAATVNPGTNVPRSTTSTNNFQLTSTQSFRDKTEGYQGVLGAKWSRGSVRAGTEFIYNWSTVKHRAVIVDTQFAPATPATFRFDYNDDGLANLRITGGDITSANNYALWGLFDNRDYATSDQKAWKADLEYMLGSGFISSIKGGIRLTERDAKFRGTTQNDIAPAAGRGVTRTATIPGFGSVSPDGPIDGYNTPHWYGADPDYLYNNLGTVRQLFGQPVTDPNFNPTIAFTDAEKTYAGYVQAKYATKIGDLPLDGLFGVRFVKTEVALDGYLQNGQPLHRDVDELDVLPVINGRLKLREDLLVRASATRAVTRPDFSALNPATTLNAPTTTGGAAGSGSGGNPELENVKSDNYDISLEYYFARGSYVSASGFYRTIEGYVQNFAARETICGVAYIVGRPRNSGEGHLQGFEVSYQHFPEFFPSALKGLGWQANFTYTDGETDRADTRAGAPVGARITRPYAQVSRTAYNLIGIYERGPFSTRLAYTWRGEFTDTFDGPNDPASNLAALRQITAKPRDFLDFSMSYKIGAHLTVTFDVTNITKSEYQDYFHREDLYPRDTRGEDRTYALGLRYRY